MLTVLFDACTLYPAPLRDLLLQLAAADLFRARWSAQIHEEWIRAVLRNRGDLARAQLDRTRDLMDRNVRDCLVTGHEGLILSLSLPDPGDRHVLAAAIRCHADAIITFNLKHFPEEILRPFGIDAIHPDDFVASELDRDPTAICESIRIVRARLKRPPISAGDHLATLQRQGLVATVARLADFAELL